MQEGGFFFNTIPQDVEDTINNIVFIVPMFFVPSDCVNF